MNGSTDLSEYKTIILDKNKKAEIRIYNGEDDLTTMNRKRIGVYLYINNEYAASEWIECGKYVMTILVNDPTMTLKRKKEMTDIAIENMKKKWVEMNVVLE